MGVALLTAKRSKDPSTQVRILIFSMESLPCFAERFSQNYYIRVVTKYHSHKHFGFLLMDRWELV